MEHRQQLSPDGTPSAFEFKLHSLSFVHLLTTQGGCLPGWAGWVPGQAGHQGLVPVDMKAWHLLLNEEAKLGRVGGNELVCAAGANTTVSRGPAAGWGPTRVLVQVRVWETYDCVHHAHTWSRP